MEEWKQHTEYAKIDLPRGGVVAPIQFVEQGEFSAGAVPLGMPTKPQYTPVYQQPQVDKHRGKWVAISIITMVAVWIMIARVMFS